MFRCLMFRKLLNLNDILRNIFEIQFCFHTLNETEFANAGQKQGLERW